MCPCKVCWTPASRNHAFGYLLPVSSAGKNPRLWDPAPNGRAGFMESSPLLPEGFRNACIWSLRAEVWARLAQPTGKITQSPCSSDRGCCPQPCLELSTVSKMPGQSMYDLKCLMTFHPTDHLNLSTLWETRMKIAFWSLTLCKVLC